MDFYRTTPPYENITSAVFSSRAGFNWTPLAWFRHYCCYFVPIPIATLALYENGCFFLFSTLLVWFIGNPTVLRCHSQVINPSGFPSDAWSYRSRTGFIISQFVHLGRRRGRGSDAKVIHSHEACGSVCSCRVPAPSALCWDPDPQRSECAHTKVIRVGAPLGDHAGVLNVSYPVTQSQIYIVLVKHDCSLL